MSESNTESNKDKVCLRGGDNWSQFEESILMYVMKFKKAGKAIRDGVRHKIHEPSSDDWVLLSSRYHESPIYILESDLEEQVIAVAELRTVPDVPDLPDIPTDIQQAEFDRAMADNAILISNNARAQEKRQKVLDLYERMYERDEDDNRLTSSARKLYNEDVRNAQNQMEKLRSDEGIIFSEIISRISYTCRDQIKSMVGYDTAMNNADVLTLWTLLQEKFGSKGRYSLALIAVKLFHLRQGKNSLDKHINEFRRLHRNLGDKAPDPWTTSILFICSFDNKPYENEIREMLMEEPLPILDDIIKRLGAVMLAEGVMNDSTLRYSGLSKSNRHNNSDATVHTANAVSSDVTCWKCGQKGHNSKVCTVEFKPCTVKGCAHRVQHCSKMHADITKYFEQKLAKKGPKTESKMLADVKKANCIPVYEEVDTHVAMVEFTSNPMVEDVHFGIKSSNVQRVSSNLSDNFFFPFELQRSVSQFNIDINDDDFADSDTDIYCSDIATWTLATSFDEYASERVCYVTTCDTIYDDDNCIHGDTASQITLVNDASYLFDLRPIRSQLCVVGIDKSKTAVTHQGALPGFEDLGITAAVLQNGNGHVLSIPQVVDNGFNVTIDAYYMSIFDGDNNLVKALPRTPNGMWGCPLVRVNTVHFGAVQSVDRNFTRTQIENARKARIWHDRYGHPSSEELIRSIEENAVDLGLTIQDVRNSDAIFGICPACVSKRNMPSVGDAMPAVEHVGDNLTADWIPFGPKVRTIGGNTGCIFVVDEYSGYCYITSCASKHTGKLWDGMLKIIHHFNSYGHRVKNITTDAESSLLSLKHNLGQLQITLQSTVPYHHNKLVERYVQTVRKRMKVILVSLPYLVPDFLIGELWNYICMSLNCVLHTGHRKTAIERVQGVRPSLRVTAFVRFGQPCQAPMYEGPDNVKMMYHGIVVGWHPTTPQTVRVYFKHVHKILSRANSEVYELPTIPQEWGWTSQVPIAIFGDPQAPDRLPATLSIPVAERLPNVLVQTGGTIPEILDAAPDRVDPEPQEVEQRKVQSVIDSIAPTFTVTAAPRRNTSLDIQSHRNASLDISSLDISTSEVGLVVEDNRSSEVDRSAAIGGQTELVSELLDRLHTNLDDVDQFGQVEEDSAVTGSSDEFDDTVEVQGSEQSTILRIPRDIWTAVAKNQGNSEYVDTARVHLEENAICLSNVVMSVRQALNGKHASDAKEALLAEVDNLAKYNALEFINYSDIPVSERSEVINALTLMTEKFSKNDGDYMMSKCRTVIDGSRMSESMHGNTSSKMVNTVLILLLLKFGLIRHAMFKKYDIRGAFLSTERKHPKRLIVKLNPAFTAAWLERFPGASVFVYQGCLYGIVKRNIYGLPDAGHEFYHHLVTLLKSIGYRQSEWDDCLWFLEDDFGHFSWVLTWVDDLFVIGNYAVNFQSIETMFDANFSGYTREDGDTIVYIGTTYHFDYVNWIVTFHQHGILQKLVEKYEIKSARRMRTPYNEGTFLVEDVNSTLCNRTEFLSLLMAMFYVARMSRPDIIFTVSYLATKSQAPTEKHFQDAMRCLRWLEQTKSKIMKISDKPGPIDFQADASFAIHSDQKGQSSSMTFIAGDLVGWTSNKQAEVATSTQVSEFFAAYTTLQLMVYVQKICSELQIEFNYPLTLYQDNDACRSALQDGFTFKRGKHIEVKLAWVREKLHPTGDSVSQYLIKRLSTDDMTCDIGTKPVRADAFERHCSTFLFDS